MSQYDSSNYFHVGPRREILRLAESTIKLVSLKRQPNVHDNSFSTNISRMSVDTRD